MLFWGGNLEEVMNTLRICKDNLERRIVDMNKLNDEANKLWGQDDLLQCAVRLQEIEKLTRFDEFQLNILDAVTEEQKGKKAPK